MSWTKEQKQAYAKNWQLTHKEEVKEYHKLHYLNNKDHYAKLRRKSHLRTKYGLTQAQYTDKLQSQNFLCLICSTPIGGEKFSERACIDHNHSTNSVRGILCVQCNLLIGYSKDNEEILSKAINYLKLYEFNTKTETYLSIK